LIFGVDISDEWMDGWVNGWVGENWKMENGKCCWE